MNLRRERIHQMGASNLAFSNSMATTPKDMMTRAISFTSLTKGKKADDIFQKKIGRSILTPMAKTQEMYETTGKLMRSKTQVGYPRLAQLEEKEKRKLVFTGESSLIYDRKLEKYRDLDLEIEKMEEIKRKNNLIKEKNNLNGNAVQETQLVGFDSADTLKNNVDLEKVREAKRLLRRRYASRKNFFKIYNAWDDDHTGAITLNNVYSMSKKLGLNLNVDESRVLLASANKTGTGELTLDEFLDLIYNKDDVLNVDLDSLAKSLGEDYLIEREALEKGDDNILKKLEENAKLAREIKHMNQTNLVLKNHINEIAMSLLEADPNRAGYVNYERFAESIKKLAINQSIVSEKDIKALFDKYKADAYTINYKSFIDSLKKFQFQHEEQYKEQKEALVDERTSVHHKNTMALLQQKAPEEFHIVDCRNLPVHSIVNYFGKSRKVNRAIKRFFPTKDDFYDYLSDSLQIEREKVEEKYVSIKELKGIVDGLFNNFDEGDVEKRDFEGFLSSFVYNRQEDTHLKEVAHLIYEEEEKEYFHKINFKKKGPGPRKEYAEAETTPTSPKEFNENNLGRTTSEGRFPFMKESLGSASERNVNIKKLLQKIDDHFFVGSKHAYDVFKAFDVDKDGYVSRKDLSKKLTEMAIMTRAEASQVLDFVDPERKGYVDFSEFHSKIRTNMVHQELNGDMKTLPFVVPSKETHRQTAETVPHTKEFVKKLIDSVRPEYQERKAKTRYGASPCWTNTFANMQANSRSPMFITETERFERNPSTRIKFQIEANEKRKRVDQAKLLEKQKFTSFFNDRIERETEAMDKLEQNRRTQKYLQQVRYEQKAKLLNSYV